MPARNCLREEEEDEPTVPEQRKKKRPGKTAEE
jgi:hypothetical protein